MTLRLILVRHAKSSWDAPALDDHARPLNPRGRRSARALGAWLRGRGHVPEGVLSSDATRTRETWQEMEAALESGVAPLWLPDLYHASAPVILDAIRRRGGPLRILMLLGHNPGIAQAARALVHTPPAHPEFARYPTGATTVLEFHAPSWAEVDWHGGALVDFTVPRDLGVT